MPMSVLVFTCFIIMMCNYKSNISASLPFQVMKLFLGFYSFQYYSIFQSLQLRTLSLVLKFLSFYFTQNNFTFIVALSFDILFSCFLFSSENLQPCYLENGAAGICVHITYQNMLDIDRTFIIICKYVKLFHFQSNVKISIHKKLKYRGYSSLPFIGNSEGICWQNSDYIFIF